jgi:hypothetical protein
MTFLLQRVQIHFNNIRGYVSVAVSSLQASTDCNEEAKYFVTEPRKKS